MFGGAEPWNVSGVAPIRLPLSVSDPKLAVPVCSGANGVVRLSAALADTLVAFSDSSGGGGGVEPGGGSSCIVICTDATVVLDCTCNVAAAVPLLATCVAIPLIT